MIEAWSTLGRFAVLTARTMLLAWLLLLPAPAAAQAVFTYVNTTDGNINSTTTCTAPLVRNFTVGNSFVVANVQLGVFATHTWRGDIRITLQSPAGTRVQLVTGNPDGTALQGDNFNVRLSDSGTQVVNTDNGSSNHSTTNPPPFQHTFIPNNPLAAFIGQASAGTWRMEICDLYPSVDNGVFQHAELYLTAPHADLSLSKTVSNGSPTFSANISYTLTVTNAASSPSNATGVTVTDLLPAGVSYTGHSGFGTYDPGTGVWTVGTLTPGQSRTLTINFTVTATAGATIVNVAEVTTSSIVDPDSTPGNGVAGEDDRATASFTVSGARVAGTPPTLICPKSTIVFDWDNRAWTNGAISQSFAVTGLGTVAFAMTNPGTWVDVNGGTNPRETTNVTGGLSPVQSSLSLGVNLANQTQVMTTQITLPMAVDGLQFRMFGVDRVTSGNANDRSADRVRVTGTYGGSPVLPVLTNGFANYVIGNEAFGDATSANNSANGNIVVTFQSPVDTIIIQYGNHALAPANPGNQLVTLHDITFCEPHAAISVTKINSVLSDPVRGGTNPVAIPGAIISYCILVTNGGSAPATSILAVDPIPANMTFVSGSMRSGTNCASATTVEDDDATGADENNPIGGSFVSGQVRVSTATLAPLQSIALTFSATVN